MDSKNERKIEPEPCTAKISDKSIDLDEENEVDGVWKTDSDKIYLFARNDPEKELWFHRLNLATAFEKVDETSKKKNQNIVLEEHDKFIKAYIAYLHNVYKLSNYPILSNLQKKEVSISITCR